MTLEEERRDLLRTLTGAFGHEKPGGPHNHLNVHAFMRQLEWFIDAKIEENNRARAAAQRPARHRS